MKHYRNVNNLSIVEKFNLIDTVFSLYLERVSKFELSVYAKFL